MRQLKEPKLQPILLSEIAALERQGYVPLDGGDASRANNDYFMVMVCKREDCDNVKIVCPSFLRGPLGCHVRGGFSY